MTQLGAKNFWLLNRAIYQKCVRENGALLDYLSTADSAMDLEQLRQQIGEEQVCRIG